MCDSASPGVLHTAELLVTAVKTHLGRIKEADLLRKFELIISSALRKFYHDNLKQ